MDTNEKIEQITRNMNRVIEHHMELDQFNPDEPEATLRRKIAYKMQRAAVEASLLQASESAAIARQLLLANQMTYLTVGYLEPTEENVKIVTAMRAELFGEVSDGDER